MQAEVLDDFEDLSGWMPVASGLAVELKLADPSSRNVWWCHWDVFAFPADWQTVQVRSTDIEFAWGPAGGWGLAELGATVRGAGAARPAPPG